MLIGSAEGSWQFDHGLHKLGKYLKMEDSLEIVH